MWACDVNDFRAALAEKLGADESGRAPKEADIVVECAGSRGLGLLQPQQGRQGPGRVEAAPQRVLVLVRRHVGEREDSLGTDGGPGRGRGPGGDARHLPCGRNGSRHRPSRTAAGV